MRIEIFWKWGFIVASVFIMILSCILLVFQAESQTSRGVQTLVISFIMIVLGWVAILKRYRMYLLTYSILYSILRSSTYAFTLCMRESLFEIANIIRDDEIQLSWQERMLSLILSSLVGFSAICIYGIRDAILRSDKAGLDVLDKNQLITRARKALINSSVLSEEPVTYVACNDALVSLRCGEICECGKCHSGLLDCPEDWFGSPRSSVCESFINYESK